MTMSHAEFSDVFNGLVLRALICKRCKAVLPVACDEADSVGTLQAKHDKGGDHRVLTRGGEEVAIWHVSKDGRVSVPLSATGLILRFAKSEVQP